MTEFAARLVDEVLPRVSALCKEAERAEPSVDESRCGLAGAGTFEKGVYVSFALERAIAKPILAAALKASAVK